MPSIADSKRLVQESLAGEPNHDAILSSLQDEIDRHNRVKSNTEEHFRKRKRSSVKVTEDDRSQPDLRFRFKRGVEDPRRKRSSRRRHHHQSTSEDRSQQSNAPADEPAPAHPFPREPVTPHATPPDDAFLSSLFDALADDEAAAYWESVYSQPIHSFSRPAVRTQSGALEEMDDESYAAYVKQKMWERKHPEAVLERDSMERKRREEEDAKRKRREDFVRRREREAWSRASRAKIRDDDDGGGHEYVFEFESKGNPDDDVLNKQHRAREADEWKDAWTVYLVAWEKLKSQVPDGDASANPSKLLPWPVLPSKPATAPNIEAFMRHIPLIDGTTKQHVLKAERVRWHPDKIQQRFGGAVDEGTMKVVTGVFQIVDSLWDEERKRNSSS